MLSGAEKKVLMKASVDPFPGRLPLIHNKNRLSKSLVKLLRPDTEKCAVKLLLNNYFHGVSSNCLTSKLVK